MLSGLKGGPTVCYSCDSVSAPQSRLNSSSVYQDASTGGQSRQHGSYLERLGDSRLTDCAEYRVEGLEPFELDAPWLLTRQGKDWDCELEGDSEPYLVSKATWSISFRTKYSVEPTTGAMREFGATRSEVISWIGG